MRASWSCSGIGSVLMKDQSAKILICSRHTPPQKNGPPLAVPRIAQTGFRETVGLYIHRSGGSNPSASLKYIASAWSDMIRVGPRIATHHSESLQPSVTRAGTDGPSAAPHASQSSNPSPLQIKDPVAVISAFQGVSSGGAFSGGRSGLHGLRGAEPVIRQEIINGFRVRDAGKIVVVHDGERKFFHHPASG